MSRRRRSRGRGDALGYALLALVVLAVGAAGAAGLMLRPPARDAASLCRSDTPVSQHTLILIDSTDALRPRHLKRAAAAVEAERARLGESGRLTVLALSAADGREPRVLFSKCDPGDGSAANPWLESPARLRAAWEDDYRAPLDRALAAAGRGRGQPASPLTEAIAAVARDPFLSPGVAQRRLVIVSDMMEHRPGVFSLYAAGADYESFRAQPALGAPPPSLAGVAVRIVQLDREEREARQAEARERFWRPYFTAAGAAELSFEP